MFYGAKAFEKPEYPESGWHYSMEELVHERKYKELWSCDCGQDRRFDEKLDLIRGLGALHGWGRKKDKSVRFDHLTPGRVVFFGHDHANHLLQPCRILETHPDSVLLQAMLGWNSRVEHKENWDKSSARKWLNGEYLENVFTKEERSCILKTEVITEPSPLAAAPGLKNGGIVSVKPTKDYCYLLSLEEYAKYCGINLETGVKWGYKYRMHYYGRSGDHHFDYMQDEEVPVCYLGSLSEFHRIGDHSEGLMLRTPGPRDGYYLALIGDYLFYKGVSGHWFSDFKIPFLYYPIFRVSLKP